MEVHHPKVENKNFKQYFLEFIMIFLAVTLGFFAESVRENISNNEHAKLLTEQLVKDLKTDTTRLASTIAFESSQRKTIDTLFALLQQPVATANTKAIQQLIVNSYAIKIFNPSTGAISAIEKELNIKQFSASELPTLIAQYSNLANVNKESENLVSRLAEQNIEAFIFAHFIPVNAYNVFVKESPVTELKMRNLTQEDMTQFSVQMATMSGIILSLIKLEERLKAEAVKLIGYVTKQYHLSNEK